MTDTQKGWNEFFRNQIKAIGDSETKEVLTNSDGSTSFRYLDPTNPDDVTVAWEVTGNSDANNRRIEKVLQVKTIPDKNDPNVSTITKTTFLRDNVINVTKNLFAAWLSRALDIKNVYPSCTWNYVLKLKIVLDKYYDVLLLLIVKKRSFDW